MYIGNGKMFKSLSWFSWGSFCPVIYLTAFRWSVSRLPKSDFEGVIQLIPNIKTGRTSDLYNLQFYEWFYGIGNILPYQVKDSVCFIVSNIFMSRPCQFLTDVYTKVPDCLQRAQILI